MLSDLKRVGVVLTAEGATDFKKTLQEVNIEVNKNYNEFKLAQSQWDESTASLEKLTAEQKYLTGAYEIQSDKVKILRAQLAELENSENKNITAIKRKQNELTNAEIKMLNYQNSLDKTNKSISDLENGVESIAEQIKKLDSELTELNGTQKENEANYKLLQSQYTNSTNATEKLRNEQDYLRETYDTQSKKVEILKQQLELLESEEEKNTKAISDKRVELINAQTELNNYDEKLKNVESTLKRVGEDLENFGIKIEDIGGKIEGFGGKVSAFSAATATAFIASIKTAIDFETAFTGVEKTAGGTEEQMAELKQGIRDMSKEIPSSTTEIAAVAEAAGQLGIETENILSFSKAMIDLGNSTNLTADEAASQLAKFANIMQMSQTDFDKLGSSIVDLGNHFATTEADIVEMAMRIAGAGKQVGLSEGQVLGLATALSSVGIEAEMGGSAISKAMVKMQTAVENGGSKLDDLLNKTGMSLRDLELLSANNSADFKDLCQGIGMTSTEVKNLITAGTNLEDFAKVSGMSADEFKKAWKEDATGALTAFIKGLGNTEDKGESAITMLTDMGLTEVRLRDSLLRAANAGDLFNTAIETGTKAFEDNTALTNEANKRYETLESKIKIVVNKAKDFALTFGNKLTPALDKGLDKIEDLTKWVDNLTDEQVEFILKIGATVIALGPLLTIVGKVTTAGGTAIKTVGTITQAMGVASGKITSTSKAVNGLASVFSAITSPVGLACVAITAAVAGIAIATNEAKKEAEKFSEIGNSANDFIKGIESAEGYLKNFNSTLFASAEEQEELQKNMNEVQNGITSICKTASDERRGYTNKEIQQLDSYFEQLRNLKNREIEIQSQIAEAITQQAQTNSETFQGSLEEYKTQSQEWIKTARDQKDETVKLIEEGTIQEVALLNQRYSTEESRQSEAYTTEYNNIMSQKQAKVNAANDEVKKIVEIYTNGYAERANQDGDFYEHLQHYNWEQEQENIRHAGALETIENNKILTESQKISASISENQRHNNEKNKIWKDMYKNMSESEAKQLGVWFAMISETQMYGGQISEEASRMANSVVESYSSMPSGTRKKMKQAMDPMLDEMKKAEPSLFAKATTIGNGIISRLKKAFDEHSPSKETRKIMKFAMQPMEEEMENGKKELFKKSDEIGEGIVDRLSDIDGNVDFNSNIDQLDANKVQKQNYSNTINYEKLVQSIVNAISNNNLIDYDKLTNCFVTAILKLGLYLDDGTFVGKIMPKVDEGLSLLWAKRERGG